MIQRPRAGKSGSVSGRADKDSLLGLKRPARGITFDAGARDDRGASADPSADPRAGKGRGLWRELLSELMYLEATSAYWALRAANPADLDCQNLLRSLQSGQLLSVGETATDEYLTCIECGHCYYLEGAVQITPCHCGGECFYRGQRH